MQRATDWLDSASVSKPWLIISDIQILFFPPAPYQLQWNCEKDLVAYCHTTLTANTKGSSWCVSVSNERGASSAPALHFASGRGRRIRLRRMNPVKCLHCERSQSSFSLWCFHSDSPLPKPLIPPWKDAISFLLRLLWCEVTQRLILEIIEIKPLFQPPPFFFLRCYNFLSS